MIDELEIMVLQKNSPGPAKIEFEAIYPIRDTIESIMFLWDFNSFYLNTREKYFIVNGGRRLVLSGSGDVKLVCKRRNRVEYSTNGDPGETRVFYILGMEFVDNKFFIGLLIDEKTKESRIINEL